MAEEPKTRGRKKGSTNRQFSAVLEKEVNKLSVGKIMELRDFLDNKIKASKEQRIKELEAELKKLKAE